MLVLLHLPAATITTLMKPKPAARIDRTHPAKRSAEAIHGLRLSGRTAAKDQA
jgi:hypothetical protein